MAKGHERICGGSRGICQGSETRKDQTPHPGAHSPMNRTPILHHPSRRRWPWFLLLAGSGVCCAAILLFPWLVLQGEAGAALSVRFLFSHLCHQDPQRSPSLAGVCLPVCGRCLALYLGGFLGVLATPFLRGHSAWILGRRALLLAPLLLTGLDAGLDLAGIWNSTLWSRAVTGGPAGLGLGLYAALLLETAPRPAFEPHRGNMGQWP